MTSTISAIVPSAARRHARPIPRGELTGRGADHEQYDANDLRRLPQIVRVEEEKGG